MVDIQSIEKAIEALPPSELAEFRRWFAEFDAAAWDAKIDQDAVVGKLDQLAAEALTDYRSGPARGISIRWARDGSTASESDCTTGRLGSLSQAMCTGSGSARTGSTTNSSADP